MFFSLKGFRIVDEGQREVNIDNSLASRFKVCTWHVTVMKITKMSMSLFELWVTYCNDGIKEATSRFAHDNHPCFFIICYYLFDVFLS